MNVISRPRHDVQDMAASWLKSFGDALQSADAAGAARHFASEGHWRDVLAFTWRIGTETGVAAIEAALAPTLARTKPRGFHIPEGRSAGAPRQARRRRLHRGDLRVRDGSRPRQRRRAADRGGRATGASGRCSPRSRS